jgi:hypothetical protein
MSEDNTIGCCEAYLEGYMENVFITVVYKLNHSLANAGLIFEDGFNNLDFYEKIDFLEDVKIQIEDELHKLYCERAIKDYLEDLEKAKKNDDNNS